MEESLKDFEKLRKELNEKYKNPKDMPMHDFFIKYAELKQLSIPSVTNMLPDEIDDFLNYIKETCITDCNDWHSLLHNKQFDSNHELYKQYLKDKK